MADTQHQQSDSDPPVMPNDTGIDLASTEDQPGTVLPGPPSVTTVSSTESGADSRTGSIAFITIHSNSTSDRVVPKQSPGSSTVHTKGTPLAVGVVRGWKLNSVYSSFVTPTHVHPSKLRNHLQNSLPVFQVVSSQEGNVVQVSFSKLGTH